MTRQSSPGRGTRVLVDENPTEATGGKPWWRGMAITGAAFLALVILAVFMSLSGGSGGSTSDGSSDRQNQTAPAETPRAQPRSSSAVSRSVTPTTRPALFRPR